MINKIIYLCKCKLKYYLSFKKSNWQLKDYPIRYRKQHIPDQFVNNSRIEIYKWSAQIINWWAICGEGDTKKEAYKNLANRFNEYKEANHEIHRPGVKAPIKYVSCEQIRLYECIEIRFLQEILEIDHLNCYISDESTINDFIFLLDDTKYKEEIKRINNKTFEIFHVNISDITNSNGYLIDILKRIQQTGDIT